MILICGVMRFHRVLFWSGIGRHDGFHHDALVESSAETRKTVILRMDYQHGTYNTVHKAHIYTLLNGECLSNRWGHPSKSCIFDYCSLL